MKNFKGNTDSLYAISDSFNKVRNELDLLEKRLKWLREKNNNLSDMHSETSNIVEKIKELKNNFDILFDDN